MRGAGGRAAALHIASLQHPRSGIFFPGNHLVYLGLLFGKSWVLYAHSIGTHDALTPVGLLSIDGDSDERPKRMKFL